jgi:RNA polymerase sigma-70 factor (ECF subfamily)
VSESALSRARAGDQQAFAALTDPYRRELQLHCYRILGQVQDAEDAVQDTLLSAWRALESFEERSSVRTWLYRIATNRSLNVLRDSARRPAPALGSSGLPFTPPEPTRYAEALWLEPYPDALLEGIPDASAGPDARYETREAVSLAFLTALHGLPPRQRAVLVLRDVLGFSAAEVAEMLDTTQTSVNSALIRARTTVEERGRQDRDRAPLPQSAQEQELVARFADAFERGDVEPIVALLTEDAWLTMPPEPGEYQGHEAIRHFLANAFAGNWKYPHRLIATRANTQPAFVHYAKDPHADIGRALSLFVLTLDGKHISQITRFPVAGPLPHFGLPRTIPW